VEILARQAATRAPDLVPIRHGRMLASEFAFFRGMAAIMAADLAGTAVSGLQVQLCGDAHLSNFGVFASAERNLIFDVNDFDETLPGPWEWDVKRLATSIEVAGRDRAADPVARQQAVAGTVAAYREAMRDFAGRRQLDLWYSTMDEAAIRSRFIAESGQKRAPALERALTKSRSKDHMKALRKLTTVIDGQPQIVADPPLLIPLRDIVTEDGTPADLDVADIYTRYRHSLQEDRRHLLEQFRYVDTARKVVGVGSVGTRCWVVLLVGRDNLDPLFLQIKEAQDSVLAPFAGKSSYVNQGQRVVVGQRLIQASSDIFLGWIRIVALDGNFRDFYVRQLWDWKGSVDTAALTPSNLAVYGRLCAWTLARGHARSGDPVAIAAYLGGRPTFDAAVARFAAAYADQNERDYQDFAGAVAQGELAAVTNL
jgi:uncharacterized protein (DUF2252 family)